jgi:phage shock protein PspC (stress-responsive transcriptional regulator)
MDKTININIAGTLFQIDEDAYKILRDYLQAVNNRFRNMPGGAETIDDIEARIAEIFRSQKGTAGTISTSNVEAMIAIIGKPEDFDNSDTGPEQVGFATQKKRIYRNPDDSIIAGVCGGIGAYLNTDPVLFRILFVILTITYGIGFFLYLALWIALPAANTDSKKREMYGSSYMSVVSYNRSSDGKYASGVPSYNKGYYNTSRIGSAVNETFRAIGRILFIAARIVLIIFGVVLVLTGTLVSMSFIMLLVFKFPASISTSSMDMALIHLSDFLRYVVNPALVPWMIALAVVVFIIPMLAIIYWGVKMIFWFRAKDGVFSLVGFVIWVLLIAVLAVILFNEGLSFAETAKTSVQQTFPHTPQTLYVKTGNHIPDQKFEKRLCFNEDGYDIIINDERHELYIRPYLKIISSGNSSASLDLRRRSSGRNEIDAMKKTGDLVYNYNISGDTLILDDYFTIPAGRKWSADNIGINLHLPEGTVLKMDGPSLRLLHSYVSKEYYDADEDIMPGLYNNTFILTGDGLEPACGEIHKEK